MIEATNNIQWVLSNKSVFLPQDLFRSQKVLLHAVCFCYIGECCCMCSCHKGVLSEEG